jgi:hypothetical protein
MPENARNGDAADILLLLPHLLLQLQLRLPLGPLLLLLLLMLCC